MEVPYDELDPGIRETVRWLNDHGFETTDSGDGLSKFDAEGEPMKGWEDCVMPFPHVVISVDAIFLVRECDRLVRHLEAIGLSIGQQGLDDGIFIQGTYDPALPDKGYILLGNLNDERLQSSPGFQVKSDTQG